MAALPLPAETSKTHKSYLLAVVLYGISRNDFVPRVYITIYGENDPCDNWASEGGLLASRV